MKIDTMQLLSEMKQTREKVATGEITVDQAQSEARLFTVQVKMISVMLEHAKATERLERGSRNLSSFDVEGDK